MKINSIQNNNPNFNAKLQLRGNTELIANDGVNKLKEVASKIGSESDIIDIAIPMSNKFIKNKADLNIAGYVNGALEQFTHSIEKTNVLMGVIVGLEKVKDVFSTLNQTPQKISNVEESNLTEVTNKKTRQCVIDMEDSKTQELLEELKSLIIYAKLGKGKSTVPNYCKNFLKLGEKINNPLSRYKDTPIFYAAAYGREDLLELLLKHPDINVNVQDSTGSTPLHMAISLNRCECIKLLLEREDIDLSIENYYGKTVDDMHHPIYEKYKANGYKKYW